MNKSTVPWALLAPGVSASVERYSCWLEPECWGMLAWVVRHPGAWNESRTLLDIPLVQQYATDEDWGAFALYISSLCGVRP